MLVFNFRIRLDIGMDKNQQHLHLDGLQVDLLQESAPKNSVHLPGFNGPHPQTSSGKRAVRVQSRPSLITLAGTKTVNLEHSAWEIVWRDNAPAGSLILGFDAPEKVRVLYYCGVDVLTQSIYRYVLTV
jgi:hypothetical protein